MSKTIKSTAALLALLVAALLPASVYAATGSTGMAAGGITPFAGSISITPQGNGAALLEGYSASSATENAAQIEIVFDEDTPITDLKFIYQSVINGGTSDFSDMVFLAADGQTEIPAPTQFAKGDECTIRAALKVGKSVGGYNDVIVIEGTQGASPVSYRAIVSQVVARDDTAQNDHIKVTATPRSFEAEHPATETVTLSLNIDHFGLSPVYNPANVTARYIVSPHAQYDAALAETPLEAWENLAIPTGEGIDTNTTASFAGKEPGVYYIHWYVASGHFAAHSRDATDPAGQYGAFGPYLVYVLRPGFTYPASTLYPGDEIQFKDASTVISGTITGWLWDFGDGATSTQQNPTHTYAEPGQKTVTLTVQSAEGNTRQTTRDIDITALPAGEAAAVTNVVVSGNGATVTYTLPAKGHSTLTREAELVRANAADGAETVVARLEQRGTGAGLLVTDEALPVGVYRYYIRTRYSNNSAYGAWANSADYAFTRGNVYAVSLPQNDGTYTLTWDTAKFPDLNTIPVGTAFTYRIVPAAGYTFATLNASHAVTTTPLWQDARHGVKLEALANEGETLAIMLIATVPAAAIYGVEYLGTNYTVGYAPENEGRYPDPGKISVDNGYEAILTPDEGYYFALEDFTTAGVVFQNRPDGTATYTIPPSAVSPNEVFRLDPLATLKSFSVTLPAGSGYTVTPEDGYSATSVHYGQEYRFRVTAQSGYEIKSVAANGAAIQAQGGLYEIARVTGPLTIAVEAAKRAGPVGPDEPAGKTRLPDSAFSWDGTLTLTITHSGVEVDDLVEVRWDGAAITAYTARRGSVVIEFDKAFTDTQAAGSHIISVEFANHYGEATIELAATSRPAAGPSSGSAAGGAIAATGDGASVWPWLVSAVLAVTLACGLIWLKRRSAGSW